MRFLSILCIFAAALVVSALPTGQESRALVTRGKARRELAVVAPYARSENNPNNQWFTYNGVTYQVTNLVTTLVANGYPALTSSSVANIAGAAWSMWNSDSSEWTATVAGQEVGVASADEIAAFTYITPANLQTIYKVCLNYAKSIGANGVYFNLILPNAPGGPRIAEFFGYALS